MELLTLESLIAAIIAVVAGLMRGFAGFGSGMLMAPVFAVLFGPIETVATIIIMEILVSIQLVPRALVEIEWRFIGPMGLIAVAFMPAGSWILTSADPEVLSRAMAGLVLIFVLVLLTGWRYHGEKQLLPTLCVGAFSGTLMAATSMGNPPVLLYMLSGQDTANTNRANIIGYFAITQVLLLGVMLVMNLLTWSPVIRTFLLTPGYLMAAWIGSRLFQRSNEAWYRRIALVFLFSVALYGLVR